jgi:hypothetical protein
MKQSKLVLLFAVLSLLMVFSISSVSALTANLVNGPFFETETALSSAYDAVRDARNAGANVTILLADLNQGGEYLSEAYYWYGAGKYDTANSYAGMCRDIAGNVKNEAETLMSSAQEASNLKNIETLLTSIVGVVVIVVLSFVVWRVFKRQFFLSTVSAGGNGNES